MPPTCVNAHYLYFGTRNKHTPASTLQEIGVQDYGVIRLLMHLLGGVVTIRSAQAHCLPVLRVKRDKRNCFCAQRTVVVKIHCLASRKNPGLSRTMESEVGMLNSSRTRASPKVKLLQSSERRRQYGLKTTSASSDCCGRAK